MIAIIKRMYASFWTIKSLFCFKNNHQNCMAIVYHRSLYLLQNVEPMQVDADPQDHDVADQQSTERNFIVENPTLVRCKWLLSWQM